MLHLDFLHQIKNRSGGALAQRPGITVRIDVPTRIEVKEGRATGVVLQGGETKADAVSVGGVVTSNEREAKNFTAGAIYSLSKRTRVFGGFQHVSVDGARNVANTDVDGVGASAEQPDRSTWTLGMRHDF